MTNPKDTFNDLMKSLEVCCQEAMNNKELIEQYNRLKGASLGKAVSPIEKMVDEATGYDQKQWNEFFDFVRDYIWKPLIFKKIQ